MNTILDIGGFNARKNAKQFNGNVVVIDSGNVMTEYLALQFSWYNDTCTFVCMVVVDK